MLLHVIYLLYCVHVYRPLVCVVCVRCVATVFTRVAVVCKLLVRPRLEAFTTNAKNMSTDSSTLRMFTAAAAVFNFFQGVHCRIFFKISPHFNCVAILLAK